jgi:hypothetical protein
MFHEARRSRTHYSFAYRRCVQREAQMALYRCLLQDKTGIPVGWKTLTSDTDAQARALVLSLLREQPPIQNVEVWRDADFVFRMSKAHLLSI